MKKGQRVAAPLMSSGELGVCAHALAATLHPEGRLVRVKHEDENGDEDRDDQSYDVELADGDLGKNMPDNLKNRVKDQGPDPAHIGDRVKPGDHDSGTECDSSHVGCDARHRVEAEERATDEAQT